MKNFSKILAVICVIAVLCAAVVFTAIATDSEPQYTGTVEELSALVAAIDSAEEDGKDAAISAVADYIRKSPVDPASEGYTECAQKYNGYIIARGEQILADAPLTQKADGYWTTATHGIALNKVSALLKSCPLLDEEASAIAFAAKCDAEAALQAEKQEANRQLSFEGAGVNEYDLPDIFANDFDDKQTNEFGLIGNPGDNFTGIEGDDANHYYTVRYLPENTSSSKNTFVQFTVTDASKGVVLEFDVTTFDKIPKNNDRTFSVEGGGTTVDDGTYQYPLAVYISVNGDLCDSEGNVLVKDALTPGEWLHISVVYNPDRSNFTFAIYLNDEYLGTCDAAAKTSGVGYDLAYVRFNGTGASESGEFSLDNIVCYQGLSLRDPDKLNRMTDVERYVYYCEYYVNENRDAYSRVAAGEYIETQIDTYWNRDTNTSKVVVDGEITAEMKERIDNASQGYLSIEPQEIIDKLKEANKKEFIRRVNALSKTPRKPDNVAKRQTTYDDAINFRTLNGANMDQVSEDYKDADKLLTELLRQISVDKNAADFAYQMERYAKAQTIAAKQRYIDYASALMSSEQSYPISSLVYDEYNNDATLKTAFSAFLKSYDAYSAAADEVASLARDENAKRIIYCINIIKDYQDEEAWEANYDFINEYILLIRHALREGNYNPDFTDEDGQSIRASLKLHAPIEKYFYGKLQEQHWEVLRDKLNKIAASDQYVEKMGMVAFIERYLEQNAIDIEESYEEMILIRTEYETYKEELASREADYEELLRQNAYYFTRAVSNMILCQTYPEQKAYYDEASLYYFTLDARVAGVAEMIEIYDSYKEYLENIAESSRAFVESVLLYQAAEGADAKFEALVDCYAYSLNAEITVDGVAEAMEIFTAAYDAYMEQVEASNGEIFKTAQMMASIRANSGAIPVISVALKLLFG